MPASPSTVARLSIQARLVPKTARSSMRHGSLRARSTAKQIASTDRAAAASVPGPTRGIHSA